MCWINDQQNAIILISNLQVPPFGGKEPETTINLGTKMLGGTFAIEFRDSLPTESSLFLYILQAKNGLYVFKWLGKKKNKKEDFMTSEII